MVIRRNPIKKDLTVKCVLTLNILFFLHLSLSHHKLPENVSLARDTEGGRESKNNIMLHNILRQRKAYLFYVEKFVSFLRWVEGLPCSFSYLCLVGSQRFLPNNVRFSYLCILIGSFYVLDVDFSEIQLKTPPSHGKKNITADFCPTEIYLHGIKYQYDTATKSLGQLLQITAHIVYNGSRYFKFVINMIYVSLNFLTHISFFSRNR